MQQLTASSIAARDRFLAWAEDNGYRLDEPFQWRGAVGRYPAVCPEGHECSPIPDRVRAGQGGCSTCGRRTAHKPGSLNKDGSIKRTDLARISFLTWAEDNGYRLDEPFQWCGVASRYSGLCPAGHQVRLSPNAVQQGRGGCQTCGRSRLADGKSTAARNRFLTWAEDNGYRLDEPFQWLGTMKTYAATCPAGHRCNPSPSHIQQGVGGCGACKGKKWDAFYVVHNVEAGCLKFGVTSGNPGPRLTDHRRDGFTEVPRVFEGLPDGEALGLEQELMRLLNLAGVQPVQGREYFSDATLNAVLAAVDAWFFRP